MKRSRSIRLVLLGSASALSLAACDEAKDPLAEGNFYRDPVECARSLDRSTCEQAYAEARSEHLRSAPAFATRESCEQQFGAANCAWQEANPSPDQVKEPRTGASPSGGGWFMPLMMGYMMGNLLTPRAAMPPQGVAAVPNQTCGGVGQPPCATSPSSSGSSSSGSGFRPSTGAASAATARPIYRDASNQVFSGRSALGASKIAAAGGVSRGGFGSTSRSYSSSSSSS
ncbi:MAG: DUF1190 domain-containing protein [Alphaproteobacteria bacterium]|nr:DUF1190 domain-containing protein [Alphaproteobacteria bacterium]